MSIKGKGFYYTLLAPSLIFMLLVVVFPLIYAVILSLQQYDLTNPLGNQFVGIQNYVRMFTDVNFWASLGRSVYFTVASVSLSFVFGLAIALLLNRQDIIANNFFRSVYLIPIVIAPMVIGATFRYMLSYDYGIINYLLNLIGLPKVAFLGSSQWALNSIILVDVWQWTPFMILVLLAGLESLPKEPYEAARIDGANFWQELRYITLPLMKPVITIAVLIRTMDAFRAFDKVFMMTSGGPGSSSETLSYYVWKTGFQWFKMGEGSARGIFMLYFVVFISWLYLRTLGKGILKGGGTK
ncbi:MAG: sugar ABC transporter permease [Firmicutes bacterium]|nr:sugar ABC transporter permease [Bacillota bacterium]